MNAPDKTITGLPPVADDQRYIGQPVVRSAARRLLEGRGQYLDDIQLPRMAHVVYWRCPVAHARIISINLLATISPASLVSASLVCTPRNCAASR